MSHRVLSRQFHEVEHGPELEHALKELGHDPAKMSFKPGRLKLDEVNPTHVDDIADDEDYERTADLLGHADNVPPVVAIKHEGRTVLLDGYARTNAAHSEGRTSVHALWAKP